MRSAAVNVVLLAMVLVGVPVLAGGGTVARGGVEPSLTTDEVRSVQSTLRDLGYDVGDVDGAVGARTRDAIRAFQRDRGLEPTGHLSERTIGMMRGEKRDALSGTR
jgi:peptidoglycan hydrolase-like protein with peptidoglycan-binding domain